MNAKRTGLLLGAGLALLDPLLAIAQQQTQPPPWDWPGHWHMWGGWGMGWLFPLLMMLFIFTIIGVFLYVVRAAGHFPHHCGPHMRMGAWEDGSWADTTHSALRILNERFARGEIQKAEYEERKAAILARGPRQA